MVVKRKNFQFFLFTTIKKPVVKPLRVARGAV